MTEQFPSPSILKGVANGSWTVREALCEFIDNSFGEARGNAGAVSISYDKEKSLLTIVDDGRGMTNTEDLLRPGAGVGRRGADIGQYGEGGKHSILYLADYVFIETLRSDGLVAFVEQNVKKVLKIGKHFFDVDHEWIRRPACPALRKLGHGTYIRISLRPERLFKRESLEKSLSVSYAPALRNGKKIYFTCDGETSLLVGYEPTRLDVPIEFDIEIEMETDGGESKYTARVKVGIDKDIPITKSGIHVSYGHRNLYKVQADVLGGYKGGCVWGYIDLDRNWPLSTTKNSIDDQRLVESLYRLVSTKLAPLADALAAQTRLKLETDICMVLKMKWGKLGRKAKARTRDREPGPSPGRLNGKKRKPGSPPGVEPGDPETPGGASIDFKFRPDEELEGRLFHAAVDRNGIEVFGNEKRVPVEFVSTPLSFGFMSTIARAIADALVRDGIVQQVDLFTKKEWASISEEHGRNETLMSDFVTARLIQTIRVAA